MQYSAKAFVYVFTLNLGRHFIGQDDTRQIPSTISFAHQPFSFQLDINFSNFNVEHQLTYICCSSSTNSQNYISQLQPISRTLYLSSILKYAQVGLLHRFISQVLSLSQFLSHNATVRFHFLPSVPHLTFCIALSNHA